MSDSHDRNKSELTVSGTRSLAIKRSDMVKRGLYLIDEVKKQKVEVSTDREKKIIELMMFDWKMHYSEDLNMFSSMTDFYKFMDTEVKFHAKIDGLDIEKAKEAYISWLRNAILPSMISYLRNSSIKLWITKRQLLDEN